MAAGEFAGQCGFVDAQFTLTQQAQVRRHLVPGLEQDEIARDEFARRDALAVAGPDHGRGAFQVSGECGKRGPGAAFLREADRGVDQDHAENHAAVDPFAEHGRDHGRDQQDQDQGLVELPEQQGQRAALPLRGETVGAVLGLAPGDGEGIEAVLAIGFEQGQHFGRWQMMPVPRQQAVEGIGRGGAVHRSAHDSERRGTEQTGGETVADALQGAPAMSSGGRDG